MLKRGILCVIVGVSAFSCEHARPISSRKASWHQMKHVLLVMSEFSSANCRTIEYATADVGKLSWRVAILEKSDDYARTKAFDLELEWDAPTNSLAGVPTPKLFRSEANLNTRTQILAVRGGVLATTSEPSLSQRMRRFIDDTLIVHVDSDLAIQWWRPTDVSRNDLPRLIAERKVQLLGLSDGSVVDVEKIDE